MLLTRLYDGYDYFGRKFSTIQYSGLKLVTADIAIRLPSGDHEGANGTGYSVFPANVMTDLLPSPETVRISDLKLFQNSAYDTFAPSGDQHGQSSSDIVESCTATVQTESKTSDLISTVLLRPFIYAMLFPSGDNDDCRPLKYVTS